MVLERLNIHMPKKRKNLDIHRIFSTKINSKWIIDLNVKHKIINLLEDNIEENLGDFGFSSEFLGTPPRA